MDIQATRRRRLRQWIDDKYRGRQADFVRETGINQGELSLLLKDKSFDEKKARALEQQAAMPTGWLDEQSTVDMARKGVAHAAHEPGAAYGGPRLPVVGTAQLGDDGYWMDLDYPTGHGDGFITYPSRDPNAYAVRCKGDSMRPRIKPGEFVVIEPGRAYVPGDEVLVKDKRGRVMVKVFNFNRNGSIEVSSVNEDHKPITLDLIDIEHIQYVAAICKPSMYYENLS